MELVLNCTIMKFQEDFFRQILGIVIGNNLAPILNNIYMAILEENITWPKVFKRFIDDGFGVIKSNKKEFLRWVNEFNCLRKNIISGNRLAPIGRLRFLLACGRRI